jgi:2-oxoacid:acceptor oxidoreductase delta subunit (pyruvate/2-ketoisovalerate family)
LDSPFAITLQPGSSRANKTGNWRTERPVYVDLLPPCNDACPAGENIQGWLYHAEERGYEDAWKAIMTDNPFPAVMGRVCYHNCETACNRGKLDEAVGINAVERFLGDIALKSAWPISTGKPATGKRILVVGAGPAGLSAAYHLRLSGNDVSIYEASDCLGGMMRFGIPTYRLPRNIMDKEIDRIIDLGINIELRHKVTDLLAEMREGSYNAIFLATGAEIARNTYIPAGDSARIVDALSLLRSAQGMEKPQLGRSVIVYGGGNTAMDAARTAKRLGASEAIVVYRRTRDKMPAHDIEVEDAIEEGIKMRWLSTINRVTEGELLLEKMELDETGFPQPTGEYDELAADSVVLALGEEADLSLLENIDSIKIDNGVVQVNSTMMTGYPGIFAGGDITQKERTVTAAIGNGKKAARNIDAWLKGMTSPDNGRHPLAEWPRLNTWYYSDAPAILRPKLDLVRRQSTFDEVVVGLDENDALFEARRCMSCGNCFECDNCYGVCPDNAVIKLGPGMRYEFDYDYCKGCGICATECPCGAIDMLPED